MNTTNVNPYHGKDIKIFTANANPQMAQQIADHLHLPLGKSEVTCFSDGEISVSLLESVRGSDCFIVQSTCAPVNDNIMELLIMMDAMKRASAARITAVIPYFGYARQDRKAKARDPISAKLVADLITVAGADRVLSMDLHVPQLQGFFNIPVDHLLGSPMLAHYFKDRIEEREENVDDYVVVSPDLGSVTRARTFAARIGCPLAIVDKRRQKANVSEVMNIIGDVRGKKVILVDDMIDTAGTLCNSATAILEKGEQPKWLPAPPTAFCPAQPLSASKTARSKRLFCWIPSRCRQRKELIKSTCFPWLLCLQRPSAASTRTSRFPLCLNRIFQRFPLLQSHGCSMAFSFCFPLDFVKPDNRRKQGNAQSPTCPSPSLCGIITWKHQRNQRFREFLRALNHKEKPMLLRHSRSLLAQGFVV